MFDMLYKVNWILVLLVFMAGVAVKTLLTTPENQKEGNWFRRAFWIFWVLVIPVSLLITIPSMTPTATPTSFAQANAAVLATVQEGDLILCTDPATNQVKRAVLIRSANESPQSNPFQGLSISEGYAVEMRGWASDII